jgi:UDP-3-O-[3-hydroxymyristoyl] glucosamine N-acyltransferase
MSMTVKVAEMIANFPKLLSLVRGDAETTVTRPCPATSPEADSIVFVNEGKLIGAVVDGPASVIVVDDGDAEAPELTEAKQTILRSPSAELAMALVCRAFFPVTTAKQPFDSHRIHPSAVLAESASIAESTIVGPNAVIGANVRIGESCIIGGNTNVEADVIIGNGCHIHAHVFIAHSTVIGNDCEIHPMSSLGTEGYGYAQDQEFNHYRHVHYGRLVIEDDVHIGSGVFIDRGRFGDSVIGEGTKIDNCCHLAHNIRIGRNCLITGNFATAGSATMGDNNAFGGRCTMSDHVTIGSNMRFAGISTIVKDIDEPGGQFGGYPLQPINDFLRTKAAMVQLPRIRKNVDRIMRKLGMT